jgi:predicted nucleotidyltransferase
MLQSASKSRVPFDLDRVVEFCREWKVVEFSLFGSVLRDDFRPDSDVDVLVAFARDADWDYWDDWVAMNQELESIFGRTVDLVERKTVINPYKRHHILSHREIIYAA